MALTNTSQNNRVMFKMKTTSRKSYFVRPNGGFIAPGATQHVQSKYLVGLLRMCVCEDCIMVVMEVSSISPSHYLVSMACDPCLNVMLSVDCANAND